MQYQMAGIGTLCFFLSFSDDLAQTLMKPEKVFEGVRILPLHFLFLEIVSSSCVVRLFHARTGGALCERKGQGFHRTRSGKYNSHLV